MHIDKVTVQPLYPTGSFLNIRLGVDYVLDEGDDPKAAMEAALNLTLEFHKEKFPHMYGKKVPIYEGEEPPVITKEKSTKFTQVETLKRDMSTCTELKVLETYKLLVKNNPELQDFYNHQEKIIQNGL